MDIILLGDPAAGKATQAAKLLKKYKLIDLDMGKELRKIERGAGNAALKKRLARTLNKGLLTPTDIVRGILKHKIAAAPKSRGILFDGTPKMLNEAKLVYRWLSQIRPGKVYFFYLTIPEREIIKRISGRREYFKGKFSKRPDDDLKAARRRIKYFRSGIRAVIKFFESKYPYQEINGLGSRTAVHKRITRAITKFNKDGNN